MAILSSGWWFEASGLHSVSFCFLKHMTGLDCPGCGLTRSFMALSRGSVLNAFLFNPAGPLIYLVFLLYALERFLILIGKPYQFQFNTTLVKLYGGAIVFLLFGSWFLKILGLELFLLFR